ncbi:hypothetical protein N7493_001654 [Penicillium malachiteum]|uniref:FAD-binding domain-containing protein n=1 Tax=Penicillium malachiteum TaxID=1324776 RepID=A0AAD6MZW0_9EURO|nr:hypothetical protein N7493_001654 [Penicillium malachiteum]
MTAVQPSLPDASFGIHAMDGSPLTISPGANATALPCSDNIDSKRVLVVGAGPVGLFLALRLAQSGIKVTVLEKGPHTSELPRACGYAAAVQHEFAKAGIYEKIKEAGGFITAGPCWRKAPVDNGLGGKDNGELVATFKRHIDDPKMPPGSGTLNFPQAQLSELLCKEAVDTGLVDVRFNAELESIQDHGDETGSNKKVRITVKDLILGSSFSLSGLYLVGADGASSTTRKLLKIPFAGHTWDRKLLATDVWIQNYEETLHPTSYVMDPTYFCVITPLTEPKKDADSLWRYTIGLPATASDTSDDELLTAESVESLYEQLMAGPRPLKYRVTNKSVYSIHQRLASTMRRGRILLAGDAAHVCNPIGALGLNTGLLDVMALHETLTMIINEKFPENLLDDYSDERRKAFQMLVDPMSTYNLLRLTYLDIDQATTDDWFFRALKNGNVRTMKMMEKQFTEIWVTNMREIAQVGTTK